MKEMRSNTPVAALAAVSILLSACVAPATQVSQAPAPQPTAAAIANPASENCIQQGGTLEIQTRGDGGQYGVCFFEDNRQCEEWALLRGDCPLGGLKVTGYITPAAQYCAITGGTYAITGNSGQDDEQGTCTFKNGAVCDALDYYNGVCDSTTGATEPVTSTVPSTATTAPAAGPSKEDGTLQPLSPEECNALAQAMGETLGVGVTQGDVPFVDPSTGASGTACETKATGTGEQFSSPDAVVNELAAMLEAQGWQEDPMLASGGPTGFGEGFRKDGQMCMAVAQWWPDESANCPKDQPISACQVTPAQHSYTVTLDCAQAPTEAAAAPTAAPAPPDSLTLANPLGFSIAYPPTWTGQQLPAQGDDTLFTSALQGTEGEVELQWGIGFGGACPEGYTTVQVAQGELPTCYTKNADGTESWTQINKELTLTGFSANARTNNADAASHDLVLQVLSTLTFPPIAPITATEVITYTPGSPTGAPQEGSCWTNSLAVWRADAWRCTVGNDIYDPCFSQDGSVICGADPVTPTVSFALTLTEPLPAAEVPADTANHAWIVELPDGTACEYATGATGGVGDERINYFCPNMNQGQSNVILGDLQPGTIWMAHFAVLTGTMPDLTVVETIQAPIRIVWR
jgi:hypothetical protein